MSESNKTNLNDSEDALNEFVPDEIMPDVGLSNDTSLEPPSAGDDQQADDGQQADNEPKNRMTQEQKLKKITVILLAVGAAASVCLVFFFYTLFRVQSNRDMPQIFDAQQLGATDSAVLLSWSSSDSADGYRIRMADDNGGAFVSDCNLPFAVLRNLQPNSSYSVDISALKDGQESGEKHITCVTESFCEITKIDITKVGSDFVNLSWNYDGVNQGFEVAAYVLDSNGKRHLTSGKIQISADGETKCTIKGLVSEMNYTVVVMPLTSYCKVGKSHFKTDKYSKEYNKFNIVRFVICAANVKDAVQVQDLNRIKPSSPYKTSLIINGKTDKTHKVDISLLITDLDGNLIKEEIYKDIYTNPDDKQWYIYRYMLFDFYTPDQLGEYYIYLVINGQSVRRNKFTVEY